MTYLVFKNYGSSSCEELVSETQLIVSALLKAKNLAQESCISDTISVISYDENAKTIIHYECNGRKKITEIKYPDPDEEIWEY